MFSETFSKLSNTLDGFIKNLDKEKKNQNNDAIIQNMHWLQKK